MPAEYVLLSADPLTDQALQTAIGRSCPGTSVLRALSGGFRTVLGEDSRVIATFFDSREIGVAESVRRATRSAVDDHRFWTDVVLALDDPVPGLRLAEAVAGQLAGQPAERT